VHDGGGDGAVGEPELCCTVGAEGGPAVQDAVNISGTGAKGSRCALVPVAHGKTGHTTLMSWVGGESEPTHEA